MDIPREPVAAIRAVVATPEDHELLGSMPDQMTQQISESPDDGEDLCCALPHAPPADSTRRLQQASLSREKAQQMAEFLGFLADPNRLRILSILSEQEMCVGDLAIALDMNESAVSHQLRTLRALRLVSFRKQGRHVFYSLQDHHVLDFYQAVIEHLSETTP